MMNRSESKFPNNYESIGDRVQHSAETTPYLAPNLEGKIQISPLEGAFNRISQMQYPLNVLEDITGDDADHYGAPGCENPYLRVRFIQYQYDYKIEEAPLGDPTGRVKAIITIGRSLPGWKCDDCHIELHSGQIEEDFKMNIANGLADGGDTRLKDELEEKRKQRHKS